MKILQLTTHAATATAERIERDGKPWLRVPVVAVREQVLNGELLTMGELGETLDAWDGVPIPINHPQADGEFVSAASAGEWPIVGEFREPTIEGRSLKGYMYLDIEQMQAMGGDAADMLASFESGQTVELSTGYYAMTDTDSGTYGGIPYAGIHRDITPDHLALLVGEVGACSIADGCGALRVHVADDIAGLDDSTAAAGESISDEDIESMAEKIKEAEVVEEEVEVTEAEATEAEDGNEEEAEQAEPVANKTKDCGCGKTKQTVTNSTDVQALIANAVAQAVAPLQTQLDKANAYIAEQEKAQRDGVVARIVANSTELTADELADMPMGTLKKLARTVAPAWAVYERPMVGNSGGYAEVEYEEAPMAEEDE